MTRIFIEGYELDLTQGLSNQITYAIDDLQNIDSKSTSFTKTIILPGTANNNKLLGNIFDFNNANFDNPLDPNVLANFNAARNASARIEIDGLQIMKGVLRLLEIIHVDGHIEYECALFGELGGFINALGNKRLEDLDFSAYNHTYSYANIVASWNTTGSTGYCYPLIDYGNVSTDKINFQYKTFKPALFVREYLDKIFTGSGYTYECDLFNTSDFRKLIVPNNSKQLTKQTSEVLRLSTDVGQSLNESTSVDFVSYENKSGSLFTAASGDTAFIYNGANPLTTTLSIEIIGSYELARGAFSISITKNGVSISGSSQIYSGNDTLYYSKTLPISFVTNDVIRVRSTGTLESGDFIDVETSFVNVINNVATLSNVELGDAMVVNDTIPKGIFQKDFVTSIMKMFNLMIIEDKYKTNHLVIKPYVDFYTGTIVDWSDKLDHSKAIKIKPMSEINARYYNFKYKQDNDFYNEDYRKKFNEGYGDRVYDNGLEFAKDTESVELIFASSPLFGTASTDKVFPAIYKKSDNNLKEDPMDHIVRIMQINKISSITSWSILNGATNLGSNTAYLFAGHLNNPTTPTIDINFGAPQQLFFNLTSGNLSYNLFNVYYSPYMAEITDKDSRLLTGFFDLTEIDIFNIDFAKFYFIDGGLYRLIKVYDYSPETNDTTKVDLLRVIDAVGTDIVPTTTTTTTTTSTTTTTTTLATFVASYSMVSAYDVCNNVCPNPARPVETFTIKNGGNTLCTAQTLTSPLITNGTITGIFWISECTGTSREFVVIIESGQFVAAFRQDACSNCPAVTTTTTTTSTTTTTTTAAPTTTTTSTTTTTTTAAPTTTTTSTTTTTTTLACECWTLVNEDTRTINYTITNCDGTEQTLNLTTFTKTRNHCIQGGSLIVINSPSDALLGEYDCGTNCSITSDCSYCGPTTTTTTSTTTTTTTAPPTTTTTTTAAPTTTTTSTTTTTTTIGYAFVDIANDTAGTDITNITINGVQVDGAVFPIVAGDGASATTNQTGSSRTILVSYTNINGDSVEVIDTSSNVSCVSATSTSRSFAGQVVTDGGTLTIAMFDGTCP